MAGCDPEGAMCKAEREATNSQLTAYKEKKELSSGHNLKKLGHISQEPLVRNTTLPTP